MRSSVKEIEFQPQEFIVHLSLWGLFGGMIWWAICVIVGFLCILAFLIALALNPRLFVDIVKEL